MKLILKLGAISDLQEIARYFIDRDEPDVAVLIVRRIYEAILVRLRPGFQRSARPTPVPDVYEIVVPKLPYIVVYRLGEAGLEVVGVFHVARDPDSRRREWL